MTLHTCHFCCDQANTLLTPTSAIVVVSVFHPICSPSLRTLQAPSRSSVPTVFKTLSDTGFWITR